MFCNFGISAHNGTHRTFCFSKWKDNDGYLQLSCLELDTDEEITHGPIQAEVTVDHNEQAVTDTAF